ncbi:MAG: glycine zipper 2TM domain-containing protein [Desulfovibrio sp.]|jgi:outer membrane lipoprotein SlyB|nr:glycine zipper 2TM domain-containing protein [Desulfovibrio sp.]
MNREERLVMYENIYEKMIRRTALLLLAVLLFSGCAQRVGQADYEASRTRSTQSVKYGTVVSVRDVHIENDDQTGTAIGTLGGGVAGGVLGSLLGAGRGNILSTVAGAALGAAAGYGGAQALGGQTGVEITLTLDDGQTIAVAQGKDAAFAPGQRVKVLSDGMTTRVVPNQ